MDEENLSDEHLLTTIQNLTQSLHTKCADKEIEIEELKSVNNRLQTTLLKLETQNEELRRCVGETDIVKRNHQNDIDKLDKKCLEVVKLKKFILEKCVHKDCQRVITETFLRTLLETQCNDEDVEPDFEVVSNDVGELETVCSGVQCNIFPNIDDNVLKFLEHAVNNMKMSENCEHFQKMIKSLKGDLEHCKNECLSLELICEIQNNDMCQLVKDFKEGSSRMTKLQKVCKQLEKYAQEWEKHYLQAPNQFKHSSFVSRGRRIFTEESDLMMDGPEERIDGFMTSGGVSSTSSVENLRGKCQGTLDVLNQDPDLLKKDFMSPRSLAIIEKVEQKFSST